MFIHNELHSYAHVSSCSGGATFWYLFIMSYIRSYVHVSSCIQNDGFHERQVIWKPMYGDCRVL